MEPIISELIATDCLGVWPSLCKDLTRKEKLEAFSKAEPLWVLRMLGDGKLLVHPDVAQELRQSGGVPSSLHRKMIWASVLASLEGDNSKALYAQIKQLLVKKFGNHGWFEIHKRVKPAYAARMRLQKVESKYGPSVRTFAAKSLLVAGALHDERLDALLIIPRD